MIDKKRRQGQKDATPKICLECGEYLKRNYILELVEGKQQFVKLGWTCSSSTCEYIIKDPAELADEAEKGTEPEDKLKKLQAEFFKTHERLNRLAEHINELERADQEGQKIPLRYEEKEE